MVNSVKALHIFRTDMFNARLMRQTFLGLINMYICKSLLFVSSLPLEARVEPDEDTDMKLIDKLQALILINAYGSMDKECFDATFCKIMDEHEIEYDLVLPPPENDNFVEYAKIVIQTLENE